MSEKLPVVTGDQLCSALERGGFVLRRITGSHHVYKHQDGRRTSVPVHGKQNVKPGTLKGVLRDAKMTAEDLRGLL